MFYTVLEFAMQLSLVFLLSTAFILIHLLLSAIRARRLHEQQDRLEAERLANEARRERRRLGDRPAIPARSLRPIASLASVRIRHNIQPQTKPVFGRRVTF